jgi:hypothetical protein
MGHVQGGVAVDTSLLSKKEKQEQVRHRERGHRTGDRTLSKGPEVGTGMGQ